MQGQDPAFLIYTTGKQNSTEVVLPWDPSGAAVIITACALPPPFLPKMHAEGRRCVLFLGHASKVLIKVCEQEMGILGCLERCCALANIC